MGLGRPEIPRRLLRHFNVLNIFEYDVETIKHVFSCIINHTFLSYPDNIKSLHKPLTNIVVDIYRQVCLKFLPLPGKSHYLFNLRDLSKVVQGILTVPDSQHNPDALKSSFAKLIYYESSCVFSDRFVSIKDKSIFSQIVQEIIGKHFNKDFDKLLAEGYKSMVESKRRMEEIKGGPKFTSLNFEDIPKDIFYVYGNFSEPGEANKIYKEISDKEGLKSMI